MLRDIKDFKKLELNQSYFADYINMNRSLFRAYVCGIKIPGEDQLKKINMGLHRLAKELLSIEFTTH